MKQLIIDLERFLIKAINVVTLSKETILIVDDELAQREVLARMLKKLGYNVDSVQSGEEAVDYLQKKKPALVLLDMVMPGIDGAETYRRILKFQPNQRAIILTGYAEPKRLQEAQKMGIGIIIQKPVSPHGLKEAVRKELDKRKK